MAISLEYAPPARQRIPLVPTGGERVAADLLATRDRSRGQTKIAGRVARTIAGCSTTCSLFTLFLLLFASAGLAPAQPAAAPEFSNEDPYVQAVLESNPTTPAELLRAIVVLVDLQEPQAARPLVKKLIEAQIDDQTALQLVAQFGRDALLKIGLSPGLAPEGKTLASQLRVSARRAASDPARIGELMAQLDDPSTSICATAIEQLRLAGPAVVNDLLRVIADSPNAAHPGAQSAIASFGGEAALPLVAALESNESSLAAVAARALAELRASDAVQPLLFLAYRPDVPPELHQAARQALAQILGRLPSRATAADFFAEQAARYLQGKKSVRQELVLKNQELLPIVQFWHWDQDRRAAAPRQYSPEAARAELALRAARGAYLLTDSSDASYPRRRTLYLVAAFNQIDDQRSDQPLASLPPSLRAELQTSPAIVLSEVLDHALRDRLSRPARLSARLLGETGDAALLLASNEPCPLVRALSSPDRAVRFQALKSIMRLGPPARFPGSSQLPLAIGYFCATSGAPQAVVASNSRDEAGRLAGLLGQLGYDAHAATNGWELLRQATGSSDVELILVDSDFLTPPAEDVVALLRQDPRTAGLPIGLVMAPADRDRFGGLLRRTPGTGMIIRPYTPAALDYQIHAILRRETLTNSTTKERITQAQQALKWALDLAVLDPRAFNTSCFLQPLTQAIFVPELSAGAARALALLGSPHAQTSLVDFASSGAIPLESRRAAVTAFCDSVRRWGILLTSHQIKLQYDRYNASEHLDPETQRLLSSILDCLEAGRSPLAAHAP
jgi:DNA-binding response OmpR family regulator